MPKVTNILGNSKVSAWESRDFVLKKKKLCQNLNFDTASYFESYNTQRFAPIRRYYKLIMLDFPTSKRGKPVYQIADKGSNYTTLNLPFILNIASRLITYILSRLSTLIATTYIYLQSE